MTDDTHRGADDELVRLYHDAVAREGAAPSPSVGDAVRAHARMLAASRHLAGRPDAGVPHAGRAAAANSPRWRLSMLGSLAVIGRSAENGGFSAILWSVWRRSPYRRWISFSGAMCSVR